MNRASTLEMVLGVTLGLIIIVLAAYRSNKVPSKGVVGRGAAIGFLAYGVIAAPLFTIRGMTFIGLVTLLVIVGLAILGSSMGAGYILPANKAIKWNRMVAGIAFAAALLTAAGQTISLLGNVDPRITVILLVAVIGFLVSSQGLIAGSRISSTALWFCLVPVIISMALGIFLGSASAAVSPIREAEPNQWFLLVVAAFGSFALAWIDGSTQRDHTLTTWSTSRATIWTVVVALLAGFGQLMLLGGVVFAPSMEFFVVPANIDALPYLGTVILATITVVFAGFIARAFGSIGIVGLELDSSTTEEQGSTAASEVDPLPAGPERELASLRTAVSSKWVWIGSTIAGVVALLGVPAFLSMAIAGLASIAIVLFTLKSGQPAD